MDPKKWIGPGMATIVWASLMILGTWGSAAAQEVDRTTPAYLYGRYGCVACHGPTGAGSAIGPAIVKLPQGPLTAEQIIRLIRNPRDMMPAYPPERLIDADLAKIISHIAVLETRR